ncbi:cation:proton antiporter [Mycoplasmopsis adleri]|uniref:cation:proton antiporter n=1 Tax=Mycoplasmopsis adleri TaxID=51362 RepID=UPI003872D4EF
MLLSLAVIFLLGFLVGYLFEKIKMPKLIWYLILGIILGPSVLNFISPTLMNISPYLRQMALVIILTRANLSLDLKALKRIGISVILLSFIPATFELIGVVIFAPMFLKINYFEAMLLGSVLAAVSPAIIVPRMIKIMDEKYGLKHSIPQMVLAGSSIDDIYVIILFYSFKQLVAINTFEAGVLLNIPTSLILGVVAGIITGLIIYLVFKYLKMATVIKVLIVFGISLGLIELEGYIKKYIAFSALISIIVLGITLFKKDQYQAEQLQKGYSKMWIFFELILFVLIGAQTDIKYAASVEGAKIVGLILLVLLFRSIGVLISLLFSKTSIKEKIFIVLAYIPKATVQASIGAIALAEGLACGTIILTAAVLSILITGPLGAILIDFTYKKLLKKDEQPNYLSISKKYWLFK